MYCIACGAQNGDQDKFCNRCGKPLVAGAAQAAAMAAAPAVPAMATAAYRQGNKLVIPQGAPLPPYCVKCAQPVTGEFFRKKFQWHNPLLFLIAVISPIIYIIVAMILMKRVELLVPMCDEHRERRKKFLIATWVLALGFIPGGILIGVLVGNAADSDTGAAVGLLVGFLMFVGAIVAGIKAAVMRPKEITPTSATFTGLCEPFLAHLPAR